MRELGIAIKKYTKKNVHQYVAKPCPGGNPYKPLPPGGN